jgi:hypothetical protein
MKPSIESVKIAEGIVSGDWTDAGSEISGKDWRKLDLLIAEAIEEARQQGRAEMREEAAKCAYNHICSRLCADRGIGGDCSAVISDQIRNLK